MKVMIELFSGSKVMSETFKGGGYKVFTIDNNPDLEPDLCINMLDLEIVLLPKWLRDAIADPGVKVVVWASPPCTTFSVASIGRYWRNGLPKSYKTYVGLAIAHKAVEIIKEINPDYYFIENPRGMLRKQHFMKKLPRKTVTYCQYGAKMQKPTDIWTNAPWVPKKTCKSGGTCHEFVGRGSKTGVQGIYSADWGKARGTNAYERAIIPQGLCDEIFAVCEGDVKIRQEVLL